MMSWYDHGMNGWGYAFTFLVTALVVAGVVLLVRHLVGDQRTPSDTRPQQILAERFARGEIDEQEYRTRLTTLRGNPPTRA
ncbi:SHOCT domain-containing protein [Actinophytocola sp.]|uniref:SHOCT domain-containing protein n=1 Tax=Actinophytocola sp. TaxID=1872138 RepID=UPI002D34DCCD|nr:SHOCT domain-containing protein [Actinophytocola sp.]HYQ63962.1 SHOCT domain-containing protein [Actinophytocola sp.]